MTELLKKKIAQANLIFEEMLQKLPQKKIVIAWTGGKDSTVLLHLIQAHFKGKVPFKVMFNDSTMEFQEIYDFVDLISKQWNLNLHVEKHSEKDLKEFYKETNLEKKKELSRIMKVHAIDAFLKKYDTEAFVVGIRKDEHIARSKETYFSKRDNHVRVHPILDFTEIDIWDYIEAFHVPFVSLYKQGYRSLGEKPFTEKAPPGGNERSGREYDKEQTMDKLRNMGYW